MVLRAHLAIIAAAVLFGSTFVVMKDAVADAEPIPFLAARFLIGAVVLSPWWARTPTKVGRPAVWCGLALVAGYVMQTVGLQYISSSESAFITYLLVVFVPLIGAIVWRQAPAPPLLVAVALACAGLWLLAGGASGLGRGQLLTVGCAISFAVHILLLDRWATSLPTNAFNAAQFAVVGGLCLAASPWTGGMALSARVWAAAVFTGVMASAVALGLQLWGQRLVGPTRTGLLLLIEPVSAAGLGYLVGDRLGARGVVGALVILAAIALAEAPVVARRTARA